QTRFRMQLTWNAAFEAPKRRGFRWRGVGGSRVQLFGLPSSPHCSRFMMLFPLRPCSPWAKHPGNCWPVISHNSVDAHCQKALHLLWVIDHPRMHSDTRGVAGIDKLLCHHPDWPFAYRNLDRIERELPTQSTSHGLERTCAVG